MAKSLTQVLMAAAGAPTISGRAVSRIAQAFIGNGGLWSGSNSTASSSGQAVNANSALRVSTVWACVGLISEMVAALPLGMYRKLPGGGRESLSDHPVNYVIAISPNAEMTTLQFWQAMCASMLLWGNAYAQIHRAAGRVIGLSFLMPSKMKLKYKKDSSSLEYHYSFSDGSREIPADEILHIPAFSLDGLVGLTPISYSADIVGGAISANLAANSTFKNGMLPTTAFKVDRVMTKEQRAEFREYVESVSGALNAGKSPVLEAGVSAEMIGINPKDAQLLETRGWNVEEICRFYRVPPWMVGHTEKNTSWGTGLEQQMLGFLSTSLTIWLRRIETAISKRLLTPAERITTYAEFTLEGLLRADSQARATFYSTMTQNGVYTRDECRAKENLPKRGGNADVLTVQTNLAPIDQLGQQSAAQTAQAALRAFLDTPDKE